MPGYQQLASAATGLQTEQETLREFERKGWIQTAEKNGATFIAAHQRYRARFILQMRRQMHLSDRQIDLVLSVQRPPYSTADIDRVLREHESVDRPDAG